MFGTSSSNLTVLCVFWDGDFRGRRYTPDWVSRTCRMVDRAIPGVDFACLTNNYSLDCRIIPLQWPNILTGWWSKLELFRPSLPANNRILYLDLDTIITGDLDEIIDFPYTFGIMPASEMFVNSTRGVVKAGTVTGYNSSVMVFDKGAPYRLLHDISMEDLKRFRGDQDWIRFKSSNVPTMPPEWFKKLRDCPKGPPQGVKVVLSMPWKNDVAAQQFDWVRKIWY